MTTGVLKFSCPSCHAGLTVPQSMAGISGPCPRCGATITAPLTPSPADPAPFASAPPATPAPHAPAPTPLSSTPSAPPAPVGDALPAPRDGTIRPEPRSRPERRSPGGIHARHSTGDQALQRKPRSSSSSQQPHRTRSGPLARIVIPTIFAAASAAIVFYLLSHFSGHTEPPPVPPSSTAPTGEPPAREVADVAIRTGTTTPEGAGERSSDPPALEPIATAADSLDAESVLEQFLSASTLEQRLDLVEPPLPASQLIETVLAGPFPPAVEIVPSPPEQDAVENLTVFPFLVRLSHPEEGSKPFTILVQSRSGSAPKVLLPPFLDLFGGNLKRFAAIPSKDQAEFRVIIEAVPRCFETTVPNPEKKFTYKLSASDAGNHITKAYASKLSPLAEQLYERDSKIRWGIRIRATVTLAWNHQEDPTQPYLELIEIKSLDWNS